MHRAIHTQMAPRKGIFMICKMGSLEAIFILKRDTEMVGEGWREYSSKCFFSGGSDPITAYPHSVGLQSGAASSVMYSTPTSLIKPVVCL